MAIASLKHGQHPLETANAIDAVARTGGRPYAALFVPALKDGGQVAMCTMQSNDKFEQFTQETRDVALAWLVELSGQSQAEYWMCVPKSWFKTARGQPGQGAGVMGLRCFRDFSKRDAAIKKFEGWLKAHPLPHPPAAPAFTGPPPVAITRGYYQQPAAPVEKPLAPLKSALGVAAADRAKMHQLVEAETLLDQRSYAEAAGIVGGILADTADYVFSFDHSQSLCRRLKPAAEALLARFPPEGRQEYELRFGDMARGRLAEAVAARKPAALDDVVARFFYTEAGAEAAYLLGTSPFKLARHAVSVVYVEREFGR